MGLIEISIGKNSEAVSRLRRDEYLDEQYVLIVDLNTTSSLTTARLYDFREVISPSWTPVSSHVKNQSWVIISFSLTFKFKMLKGLFLLQIDF